MKALSRCWWTLGTALLLACALRCGGVEAGEQIPIELRGVGVTEHLGENVPLEVSLLDEQGQAVTLRQLFAGGRPVVLVMAYYSCPMLCTMVLNGLTQALKELAWTPGREFEIVTVSIDPRDTASLAAAKKQNYVRALGRAEAAQGWHFLTGTESQISALAAALGFQYRWDARQSQYAHAAVVFVLTPEGKISRYLYGIQFPSRDLRLALLEASEGKIGSALEQLLLFCYHYDPVARKYALYATNLMRLGGALTALLLGTFLARFWWRERRTVHGSSVVM